MESAMCQEYSLFRQLKGMCMAKAKAQAADTLIGTVSRVKREEIRVTVRQSQGKKWLDLRIFYEDETGRVKEEFLYRAMNGSS
jgi:hypothetical protein